VTTRPPIAMWFVVAVLTLAACGKVGPSGAAKAEDPVTATQARLAKTEKADLDLRLVAADNVGFELKGPFAAPTKDGALPVAKLTMTRLLGDTTQESTFVADGTAAYVETTGGQKVELTGNQLSSLRATTAKGAADLGGLHLDKWFATRDTKVNGDTTVVTGELDAAAAVNDVFGLAGSLGTTASNRLTGDDADRLRKLVQSSRVELVTTTKSYRLRSLHWDVRFAAKDEPKVAQLLPDFAGVNLAFDLKI
jgi:predicted small lipoprotein YifL